MQSLLQDLRYALRMLAKRPSYAAALILMLALGIGATSVIFSIVNGVLLEPLPYKNPAQIVVISGAERVTSEDSLVWWGQGKAFSVLAEYRSGGVNLSDGTRSQRVFATTASASLFPLFGLSAQLGRTFSVEDEAPQGNQVVILSHRLWSGAFASDSNVIGRAIVLNAKIYTIIGVMPSGFSYPGHTDLWIPRNADDITSLDLGSDKQPDLPGLLQWSMLGRLNDGVTVAQAQIELKSLLQLESQTFHPERHGATMSIRVIPLREVLVGEVRTGLLALLGAVVFLLLIACLNVANLMLVRVAARQKEVAVRLCMGASRVRILRQMFTESTMVALLGGSVGILFSFWGVKVVQLLGPKNIPRLGDVRLDSRVLAFTLGVSILAGTLVGLAPAFQALGRDLTRTLKEESLRSTGTLRHRLRGALVVTEVALSLVLLMGSGLMFRSLGNLLRTSPGFETQNVLSMEIALPEATYLPNAFAHSGLRSPESRVPIFFQRLFDEVASLPGVLAVGGVNTLPLSSKTGAGLYVEADRFSGSALEFDVSGEFFRAMRIPVIRGRAYTEDDLRSHANVIIVNQAMALAAWPREDPYGKTVKLYGPGPQTTSREVIGVVQNVKFAGLGETPKPEYYLPAEGLNTTLVVRANSDPRTLVESIRNRVRNLDANVPLFNVRTMSEVVSDSTSAPRFRGVVVAMFAALSFVLAMFGLYSVLAYSVTCRTHEIGVRISLGAKPRDILMMVAGEGTRLASAGVVIGAVLSFWLNKLIRGLLYGISPTDTTTLVATAATLAAGTLVASLLPALRASRSNPASALRWE
jgi:putative ABC transport system permease protein